MFKTHITLKLDDYTLRKHFGGIVRFFEFTSHFVLYLYLFWYFYVYLTKKIAENLNFAFWAVSFIRIKFI